MSGTAVKGTLWGAREAMGLSRERVAPQLDPPVSAKTLERWEKGITPVPRWRLAQFARLYRVKVRDLEGAPA